ncbi:hypothetical protein K2V69_09420 [Staphylococcus gallinarum]|uniref:hypothetical protein n=1 Tax=Staphylococcus gallinarum TaxID=1293 RepID=UPI001E2F269A|nr:hypothetical protein [Staphylococcus gallinarum]MCD8920918.1 hypothetical protein [Staphylococcus gallinarum]
MKIKTKKQLNLPQLIEWAWENGISNKIIRADKQLMNIEFDEHGDFRTYGFTGIDTIFTIEVEELINETTRFEMLAEIDGTNTIYGHCNSRIVDIINYQDTEIHAYIDGEFKCIWRDGKLVE